MRAIACALITLFLGILLRELGFKGNKLVLLLGTVSLIGYAVIGLGDMIATLPGVLGENEVYAVAMLKIVGVGYAFGVCSDICTELGESGLSGAVTLFGKVEIMILSLPFVKNILEKSLELL